MSDSASTKPQAVICAGVLTGSTVLLFVLAIIVIGLSENPESFHRVDWSGATIDFEDKSVSDFWQDTANKQLVHRGRMNNAQLKKLIELKFVEKPPMGEDPVRKSYDRAVRQLQLRSMYDPPSLWVLLLVTALGGVLGVQARSISYFIVHACVQDDLDLRRWWPWYWLRPLLGMLFGPLVVAIGAGLMSEPDVLDSAASETMKMFAASILVGIVASMFFDKLVQLAQTVFGLNANDTTMPTTNLKPLTAQDIKVQGEWDKTEKKAVLTWSPLKHSKLTGIKIQMSPGTNFNAATAMPSVTLPIDSTTFSTAEGLANSGDAVSFRVVAILGKAEVSSETHTVTHE